MQFYQVLFALLSLTIPSFAQQLPSPSNSSYGQQQTAQQQQQQMSASSLQAHLNAMQAQAQRQIGQLNGLVLGAVNASKYSNVLEAISSVGKAIHQQISAATNPNHVNIITGPASSTGLGESANNKKNEYQSIVGTDQGGSIAPLNPQYDQNSLEGNQTRGGLVGVGSQPTINYREQGELIRQDIMRRAGQLQAVLASTMDLLKNNGDQIVRRLLESMNVRLDQAKAKADKIINEPATNEVALKALSTINLSLNHLNTIISNIVNRLDQANKENQYQMGTAGSAAISQRQQQASGGGSAMPQLLDTNRFRSNLHQLGSQFQSVLNNSQLHQQLMALRQRQQQQQQQQQPLALLNLVQKQPQQAADQSAATLQAQPSGAQASSNKLNTAFTGQ